jgi:hypothetical protein
MEISSMHGKPIRAQAVSGFMLALAAVAITQASPARAAAGPTVTYASCGDTSYLVTCEFSWSGGTSPFVVTWAAIESPMSPSGGSESVTGHSVYVSGNCVPQAFYEVKATITDAKGLSATAYAGGRCD